MLTGQADPDQEIPGPPPSDPDSRSRPNRESGIPCFPIPAESGIGESPFPGKTGKSGESGIRSLPRTARRPYQTASAGS
jgi:hypothetical protein